jgi:hypothetical protein
MKNVLIALLTGCISVVGFANSSISQGKNNVIAFTDLKKFDKSLLTVIPFDNLIGPDAVPSDEKNVNKKALKDFKIRFTQVSSAQWFTIADGFISYFKADDDISDRVYYNKKGNWTFTVKTYNEGKLPRDIRAIVKSSNYDFAITLVEEVQSIDNLVYIIHMQDKTSIKNVRVSKEGEMDVLEEFTKG